jgi:metal-dependent hydrolase (beta-lactamase superfamily II)
MPFSDTYILDLAKRMKDEFGVKIVCPTHCTGEDATAIFKKYYKENFVAGGVGTKIVF